MRYNNAPTGQVMADLNYNEAQIKGKKQEQPMRLLATKA